MEVPSDCFESFLVAKQSVELYSLLGGSASLLTKSAG
jgi:hypothetical protein